MAILLGFLSVFPAYAGVILSTLISTQSPKSLSRIRGGDPVTAFNVQIAQMVFPAYAGVIPVIRLPVNAARCLSRIRGGDPVAYDPNNKQY